MRPTLIRMLGIVIAAAAPSVLAQPSAHAPRSGQAAQKVMDPATGKVLNEAIELLNAKDFEGAAQKLAELRADRLSPYERSKVEQVRFNIAFGAGSVAEAREHLAAAVAAGGLNAEEIAQARYQDAQLLLMESHWGEGAAALEDWLRTADNPNSAAYYLLAVAYYQNGDFDRALAPARQAVELTDEPKEPWMQLLLALRLQRQEYADAARLLQQLIVQAPGKRSYFMQLSSVYGQMHDYESALAIMQVAYDAGLLNDDPNIRRLADLLLLNHLPYRGAQVLEAALDADTMTPDAQLYEKLATCWIAAGELDRAVLPLRRAGELSSSGEPYLRLGEVELQRQDWPAAESALRGAVAKGGLRDAGNAPFLLGVALFNQGRLTEARASFVEAEHSSQHREAARAYLRVIESRLEHTQL
jgi:tetratricopeptide (TPR) repeat protein